MGQDKVHIMLQKLTAEFIGTFALVFCGTGTIIIDQETNGAVTHAGIALTFGAIVTAMVFAFGKISGAHLNPAVSLALRTTNKIDNKILFSYTGIQTAGAFTASALLKFLFPANISLGSTIPAGSDMQSFLLEVVLAFILMLVIFFVSENADEKSVSPAIAIGATVGLEAMFAGPICGASMNPARSLAPALLSGNTQHLWIYLTAPFSGTLLAVVIYQFIYVGNKN